MEAGSEEGGGCETIVVVREAELRVVEREVEVFSWPGTELNVVDDSAVRTVMSKRPALRDLTWTVTGSAEVSSV